MTIDRHGLGGQTQHFKCSRFIETIVSRNKAGQSARGERALFCRCSPQAGEGGEREEGQDEGKPGPVAMEGQAAQLHAEAGLGADVHGDAQPQARLVQPRQRLQRTAMLQSGAEVAPVLGWVLGCRQALGVHNKGPAL